MKVLWKNIEASGFRGKKKLAYHWAERGKPCGILSAFYITYFVEKNAFNIIKKKTSSKTATAGSELVQSGRPIFDDFFQHLWPYIGNNTANVVFQMVKRLWLIRIDQ
ncbi:hypothetical protein TNCV_3674081 [Trichonephila clavipes]|nr:hypothetical protein TNCV_3674081 [Trichonephila clavipes]